MEPQTLVTNNEKSITEGSMMRDICRHCYAYNFVDISYY